MAESPTKSADDVRQLFTELEQAYARVAAAVPPALGLCDANAAARFMEESQRVCDLIQRIRKIQGL
jgi:hypothetical protein